MKLNKIDEVWNTFYLGGAPSERFATLMNVRKLLFLGLRLMSGRRSEGQK